ncbi:MAG: DUF6803 family protein [Methanomicrobiales archaeon]
MQMESMVTPTVVDHAHVAMAAAATAMDPMMQVTHYMQLLMTNQPWNLLLFMAIPVILAEALTATEFFVAFKRDYSGTLRNINRYIGISLGIYFTLIAGYLLVTVIPTIVWRGPIDIIAVGFYVAGFIPLLAIALLELGIIEKSAPPERHMVYHISLLITFLVFAHIAMIFGMLNPTLL